ncbi:MAG: acetyl-CoA carboxylase biotin carboxylase subunit [Planctomycetes bacterium]|nr:acetyl-CoA carboxylase biotin carboxylase subunit [Planctomycetota bacterium]
MTLEIKKVLIANRGEIARRVIRTLRELGIASVSVYSDVDEFAPFACEADESYHIGGNAPSESYLDGEKIIQTARRAGCDAIHPGYGFLSENSEFAKLCEKTGIKFIGPPSKAIAKLGSKIESRKIAKKAGVQVVPGTEDALSKSDDVRAIAESLGFPLLVKASAGGGGKGMRVVREADEIEEAVARAASEAKSAFGSEDVFLERYLETPKHVEIQILADSHGNCVALYERECSIQRRHQKLIEESPCMALGEDTRAKMFECATNLAKTVGYEGAGTVEFLLDGNEFYFLEVNTRLQVEHPVTEMILGLDLVAEQIRVARGEKLRFAQEDVIPRGHAIECRVTAEDPSQNFMPCTGRLDVIEEPAGPFVRVDSGVVSGSVVSPFYDSMLSKVIAWGETRDDAIERMKRALREYMIAGIRTSIPFHLQMLDNAVFRAGSFHVKFVDREFKFEPAGEELTKLSAIVAALLEEESAVRAVPMANPTASAGWREAARIEGLRR